MKRLDIFTVRELRTRTGDLLRDAEAGRLALVTKHGRPAFLTVPFDDNLIKFGVTRAIALHLFSSGRIGISSAAKIAGVTTEAFIELLGKTGMDAVDHQIDASEINLAQTQSR